MTPVLVTEVADGWQVYVPARGQRTRNVSRYFAARRNWQRRRAQERACLYAMGVKAGLQGAGLDASIEIWPLERDT